MIGIVTIEDKIALFREAVLEELASGYAQRQEVFEAENEILLKDYEDKVIEKSKAYIKEITEQGEYERKMILSQAKSKVKAQILQKRQNIVEGLLDGIQKEALQFTQSPEYPAYLKARMLANLAELKSFGTVIVSLDRGAYQISRDILQPLFEQEGFLPEQVIYEEAAGNLIGGVKFYNPDKTIRVDESFETLIADHKKRIGQYVHDMIQEAGDAHE